MLRCMKVGVGRQPVYDVIVVGSGAAGGIASYVLATRGLRVLCLEAGRMIDPAVDFHPHKLPFHWPYRGKGRPGKYGQLPQGMEWKINEWTEHLYTIPKEDPYALAPGSKFTWTRIRAVGGRTLLWGRNVDRFGPLDFKPKSLQDGVGEDWPIGYEDVAPYYDRVEALIGVSGSSEEVFNTPSGKKLLPPFRPRCGELLIKRGAEKLGIKVLPYPLAVLSRNLDGRAACHYCGACNYGQGARRHVHRRAKQARLRGARQSRRAGSLDDRVDSNPLQLEEQGISKRTGQLERHLGSLPDGTCGIQRHRRLFPPARRARGHKR
ncbi:MAG: hypothetical protein DMG10_08185 [Acidobacteria bacterium]|nr:MAG: hypothetical protein DMG10_08185 [Acidobacteriota bacterium]